MTTAARPDCITHWSEIEGPDTRHYPQDDELLGLDTDLGRPFGLTRLGLRLLVVGDTDRDENSIFYPLKPDRRPLRSDWWEDVPARPMGPHDGLTDARRAAKARQG